MAFRFSSLNKRVQLAISLGVPSLIAIGFSVIIYQKLGELGPDPSLPGFLRRESIEGGNDKWGQINVLQADINKQDGIIKLGPLRQRELEGLEKDIEIARERLPKEKDILEIVQRLGQLAREIPSDIGTVKVGAISYRDTAAAAGRGGGPAAAADELPQISFNVELDGDINGVIKYIDSIEKFPRFMSVTNITIKSGKVSVEKDKESQVTRLSPHHVTLTLVTYTYAPKQTGRK